MKQSGAVEACWAHNSEVGRSKLPSATALEKIFGKSNQHFFFLIQLMKL